MYAGERTTRWTWVDVVRVIPVLVVLFVPFVASAGLGGADVSASPIASCPDGVGRGGVTASSAADTRGGHGCVAFEYEGQFDTFTFAGAVQSWTVPAGLTSVVVHIIGAGGGGGRSGSSAFGGGGGYATGRLAVTAGQQFDVIVGEAGRRHCVADVPPLSNLTGRHNFSYGGGGTGNGTASYDCSFASGGGRSAIRISGGTDDLVTAGGGGGGGYTGAGGPGGGLTGGTGGGTGGAGGTQSAGGASAAPEIGVAGIKYAGGWAGYSASTDNAASEGGGGGGGYYGGGAAGDNGGGGGGSSYLGTLTSASTTSAVGRNAAIAVPTVTSAPTIPAQGAIGSTITATPGTWGYTGEASYKWQYSETGSSYVDVAGATGLTFVPSEPGFVRLVETRSNFLGSTSATSAPATVPDTRLASLSLSAGALSPSFSSTRTSYSVSVGYRTTSIRLTPTVSGAAAVVRVAGAIVASGAQSSAVALAVGDTTLAVRVESGGAATETTVVVTRSAAAAPGAPMITAVTGGDGRLTVTFDGPADDGGETIVRYEYSIDGTTWVAIDGPGAEFEITGLANGSTYDVRVRAVNTVGAGVASTSSRGVPMKPADPTTTTATTTTSTSTTTTTTSITTTIAVTTTERARRSSRAVQTTTLDAPTTALAVAVTTTTEAPSTTLIADAADSPGAETPTTIEPTTTTSTTTPEARGDIEFELVPEFGVGEPAAGARVRAQARGLAPSTAVRLEVRSEPVLIGETTTNAAGDSTLSATLPADLEPGAHMLILTGVAPTGEALVSVAGLEIDAWGVIATVTPASAALAAVPDESRVEHMLATKSAPYDGSKDVGGAVALAGAAVVLMGLATGGSRAGSSGSARDAGTGDAGSSESDSTPDAQRDETAEGSLASADAKVLQVVGGGRAAWGDRSHLWALPGWSLLGSALLRAVRGVERWSTLAVRVLQDGTWIRAAFGVGSVVSWIAGACLGIAAQKSVGSMAVPPAFGFIVAIVAVSFIDSLAGACAWVAFSIPVVARGGVSSWFDLRTILGLGVLFVALPLIAASFRPIVRPAADGGGLSRVRVFDYLVVPAFVSFAAESVYGALNGLSGLAVVDGREANTLRWLCLGLAAGRMLLEDATSAWFPARRAEASVSVERATNAVVPYVNVCLMLCIYVLTAGPYMGTGPRTWFVMGLMSVVPLVKIHRDKLPNVALIHRWFPRGILRSVIMLYAMAYYGRWLVDVTNGDARAAVPLTLLPAIAIGLVDCLGRTGGAWSDWRLKNGLGAVLWVVSFSVVAGWLTP